jgi:hypothetical protein
VGSAGGIAVGFRQRARIGKLIGPVELVIIVPGGGEVGLLSQVWLTGVGRVAPVKRLKRVVEPFESCKSVAGSGGVLTASEMSVAN